MRTYALLVGIAAGLAAGCAREDAPKDTPARVPTAAPATDASTTAPANSPAESGLAIKRGVMTLARDRTTFRPCGSEADLWVLDQTDGVLPNAFGSEAASAPAVLYVEAYGERAPADSAPQASDYAGVFILEEVLYAGLQDAVKGCAASPANFVVAARGTEPFWAVEVTDEQIVWRQPEEPREVALDAPLTEPVEGAVRYHASDAAHTIEVLIESQACRDAMSGEFFAYSARATLDGRGVSGCARVGR